jgi:hypothetical protein
VERTRTREGKSIELDSWLLYIGFVYPVLRWSIFCNTGCSEGFHSLGQLKEKMKNLWCTLLLFFFLFVYVLVLVICYLLIVTNGKIEIA